ncbi:hypothetical protein K2X96_04110 [Patescibacteria group bacterium]|nr:hypothetical protein [Patescibacteria group bacterium]
MTKRKKIALATLPALALIILGSSVASAYSPRAFAELTEEQRSALEEARELFKEGSRDEAKEVLKEAGLPEFRGHGKGHGMKDMTEEEREKMAIKHQALKEAVENNDFAAFKEATLDAPFRDMVTEENFTKLVEANKLREAGDKEGAFEILKELGFGKGMHRSPMGSHMMGGQKGEVSD